MICAVDELGIGTDHTGILVLAPDSASPGDDAIALLGLSDEVLDIAVTADMGYCLSVRGLARETAQAFGAPFTDPVAWETPSPRADGFPVRSDTGHCPLFVAVSVTGVDPTRPSPDWMQSRLRMSGMRSVSLSVDITNYVMLEAGQPLHAYDADRLAGGIVVREAVAGERLTTLDDVSRVLSPEDLVITDDSGVIGLAGVMGGQTTELTAATTNIVIEAASFDPVRISRTARRHKLPSEASRRFERGVDPGAAYSAAHRVADLLVELAGGTISPAETVYGTVPTMPAQTIRGSLPAEVLGAPVQANRVVEILRGSGVDVTVDGDTLTCVPPTWRPDLVDPYDYVEEVGNKIGLDSIVPVLPRPTGGRGLTARQKARRALSAALPAAGFVEVIQFPFLSDTDLDKLGVAADDERRDLVRVANPLAETSPYLRTTMLPGLFGAVARNMSRGQSDLALYEVGTLFRGPVGKAPMPSVEKRPSDEELAAIYAALPQQADGCGVCRHRRMAAGGWRAPCRTGGLGAGDRVRRDRGPGFGGTTRAHRRLVRSVPPGPLRPAVRGGRHRRPRGRAASERVQGVRPAAPQRSSRALVRPAVRPCARPRFSGAGLLVAGGEGGCRADRRRVRPGRRRRGGAPRGCRRPARGRTALRRVRIRRDRRRQEVARVRAEAPCPRPDAHRGRGCSRTRRGGRGGNRPFRSGPAHRLTDTLSCEV